MGEYLAEKFSVTNVSSKEYRVIKELGRVATVGRIWADGLMFFQVSKVDGGARNQLKATLFSGREFEFKKADGWVIGDILLTTDETAAVSGRILLK